MDVDDEIINEVVDNPHYCSKCSRRIFSLMTEYILYMDSYFAPPNNDFQRNGDVCLCKKCFRRTRADWMQNPPIQRPDGWWKKIVDPQLKGWTKMKKKLFAPIKCDGPCDNCGKREHLYKVEFPTGRKGLFGIDKHEKRYFCEECMQTLSQYLVSR